MVVLQKAVLPMNELTLPPCNLQRGESAKPAGGRSRGLFRQSSVAHEKFLVTIRPHRIRLLKKLAATSLEDIY
jgi:hypothetical protein